MGTRWRAGQRTVHVRFRTLGSHTLEMPLGARPLHPLTNRACPVERTRTKLFSGRGIRDTGSRRRVLTWSGPVARSAYGKRKERGDTELRAHDARYLAIGCEQRATISGLAGIVFLVSGSNPAVRASETASAQGGQPLETGRKRRQPPGSNLPARRFSTWNVWAVVIGYPSRPSIRSAVHLIRDFNASVTLRPSCRPPLRWLGGPCHRS